jgi:hypothetical protein
VTLDSQGAIERLGKLIAQLEETTHSFSRGDEWVRVDADEEYGEFCRVVLFPQLISGVAGEGAVQLWQQ